jgi:ribosome biogenesis GTPase
LSFDLASIGWTPRVAGAFDALDDSTLLPARISAQHRGGYNIISEDGPGAAVLTGRFAHHADSGQLPAVGDWVAIRPGDPAVIVDVLPRASQISRKVAGLAAEEQILAANVDVAIVIASLESERNDRRIERYLTLAWEGGAQPVVVLTKKDLVEDWLERYEALAAVLVGTDIVVVSNVTGDGFQDVQQYLEGTPTLVVLGPSGAGKSSFINQLFERDVMTTKEVRWDGKGRHTTTHRELLPLPGGGAIIDTPGLREVQLWLAEDGVDATFSDIAELAGGCRFSDCRHDHEPGCAVLAAVDEGTLPGDRLVTYRKQQREIAALARRTDRQLANKESKRWRQRARDGRARAPMKDDY